MNEWKRIEERTTQSGEPQAEKQSVSARWSTTEKAVMELKLIWEGTILGACPLERKRKWRFWKPERGPGV